MRIVRCLSLFAALLPLHAQVVISQVYGGGGNSGAPLLNDYIEIFNRGNSTVDLSTWSVQYASATGTGNFSSNVTVLSGTLAPGQYYLIQEGSGGTSGVALPTPDKTGTINMSASAGKVIVANTVTGLACNGSSTTCSPTDLASIQDLVGYGGANFFEGAAPAPLLSNTTSDFRAGNGCTDTNNNGNDFAAGAPAPRNTASALNTCAGGSQLTITTSSPLPTGTVNQAYTVTFAATGGSGSGYSFSQTAGALPPGLTLTGATLSGTPTDANGSPFSFTIQVTDSALATATKDFQVTINPIPVCTPTTTISAVQGSGDVSPVVGTSVTISGIVTGRKSNGFFIQMPAPGDSNSATSDGIFIFTSSAPPSAATVGNEVCVSGNVQEFIPSSDPASPSQTEVSSISSLFATSSGNPLPAPVVLSTTDTDPAGPLLELEKYEGMRVQVNTLNVVAPTRGNINEANATATSVGIFYGVLPGIPRPFREPGVQLPDPLPAGSPCCVPRWDTNPEVLSVNTLGQTGSTALDVTEGQTVSAIVGPVEYAGRAYTIDTDPSAPPTASGTPLSYIAVPVPDAGELTVGNFNMERFYDTVDDPSTSDVVLTPAAFANRLNKASLAIRNVMRYPDILGVEEMENLTTLQTLASKISADALAAGDPDPQYQSFLVEGNDIGGIDVGFLVKSPKVTVVDVTQYGKDATYFDPVGMTQALLNDRPPLVLRATVPAAGRQGGTVPFTVIVNHLRSLNDIDDPTDGPRVRAKREAQAEYLANLIQGFQTDDINVNLISVGDYNAYQFNDGYADVMGVIEGTPVPADQVVTPPVTITNPTLTDLLTTAPPSEQYSYSFNGDAQELDHILANPNAFFRLDRYAVARNDADFPEVFRNDPNRPERISDHDMPVAYFTLNPRQPLLSIDLDAKAGPQNARIWTFGFTVRGTGTAYGVELTGLALAQVSGTACTPVVAPAQFPVIAGDIAASTTANANVTIDFTGCASNARFKATASYRANGGAIANNRIFFLQEQ